MSITTMYPLNAAAPVQITREEYNNVGSGENILGTVARAFKNSTDFEVWDSVTGGTQLTEGADYNIVNAAATYGADIYTGYQITNGTYQTGALFFTYKTIGTFTSADFYNTIQESSSGHYRDALINGNFDIWQRGVSFTAGGFTADRFFCSRANTETFARAAFPVGGAVLLGLEPAAYYHRSTFASSAVTSVYELRLENPAQYSGQTWTFNFWVRSSVGAFSTLYVDYLFDFAGDTNIDGANQNYTISTSFELKSFTFNFDDLTGKTIGASDTLKIRFAINPGATGTFDIAQMWMNQGAVMLPFQPRHAGEELGLAQKFCYQLPTNARYACIYKDSTQLSFQVNIPVSMRGTPVFVLGTETTDWNVTSDSTPVTGFSYSSAQSSGATIHPFMIKGGGHGLTGATVLYLKTNTANNYIDAEL